MRRTTTRWNDKEEAELDLLKKAFNIDDDSKAIKLAVEWVNHYQKNVAETFYPPSYDVILVKKTKTNRPGRKVYD